MRYFSLEEANEVLPQIEPLMAQLLEIRGRVVRSRHQMGRILKDTLSDVGGEVASQMVLDFMEIERLAARIQSYGCVIKNLNAGLLDFLSRRDGRDVYLCWRFGEPEIGFFHDIQAGFNGRQQV